MRQRFRGRGAARTASVAALLAVLAACAKNPVTGQRELMLVSEAQEIEMGRQADRDVVASIGVYPDRDLQAYVERLGGALAAGSERPKLPWTFRVADDPAVNAFALPGGFIYVTRGILAHLDSEAELVAVLGHEIGHVTARHSARQISRAQFATLGLGVGMILRPELQGFGGLAQTGLGLMFLKFGRDDERQADELGLRYLTQQNYDPREMVEVFRLLERAGEESGGDRLPSWFSTHPSPEDRQERIAALSRETGARGEIVNRKGYLRTIDGLVFGENPREGFFVENAFYHPDLRFQVEFPRGWKTQNQRDAVAAVSPSSDAVVVVTLSGRASPEAAADEFFSQRGLRAGRAKRAQMNGLRVVSARFEAESDQGVLAGLAGFLEHEGKVYRILGYTSASRYGAYDSVFEASLGSFKRLTAPRHLNVEPRRIQIVDVDRDMRVEEFALRYPSTVKLQTIALINHLDPGEEIRGGQPAKRVVGGQLPQRSGLD